MNWRRSKKTSNVIPVERNYYELNLATGRAEILIPCALTVSDKQTIMDILNHLQVIPEVPHVAI